MGNSIPEIPPRLGPYVMRRFLGRGGMGAVYQAHDERLGRSVAVKILLSKESVTHESIQRFAREMKALASLSHANIVKIFDVGSDAGFQYFAMELLDGCTLKETIDKQKSLPGARVMSIGIGLSGALAEIHAKGMLHRDIKPQNVIIRADGTPILMDLGLVKVEGGTLLTEAGSLVGTPRYLPPEVIQGHPFDARSDVYQLGLVLYEAATGRMLFSESNVQALIRSILQGAVVPPRSLNPAITQALSDLILWATQRAPQQRAPDAVTLMNELGRLAGVQLARPEAAVTRRVRVPSNARLPAPEARPTVVRLKQVAKPPSSPQAPASIPWALKATFLCAMLIVSTGVFLRHLGLHSPTWAHRSPTSRASMFPSTRALPDRERIDRAGSPEPSPVTAPGHWSGGWEPYVSLLPRLRAGGATADRAAAILRKSLPIDFGVAPAAWAYWLELNMWLSHPKGEEPPVDLTRGLERGLSQDVREVGAMIAYRHLAPNLAPQSVVAAFEGLHEGADDGRRWLVLGRLLELDGRPTPARTMYAVALNKLRGHAFRGYSAIIWEALARAILACGVEEQFFAKLLPFVGEEPDRDILWSGICQAITQAHVSGAQLLAMVERAGDDPRLDAAAYRALGDAVLDREVTGDVESDPDVALRIWDRGMRRFPADKTLELARFSFLCARGEVDAARRLRADSAGRLSRWDFVLALVDSGRGTRGRAAVVPDTDSLEPRDISRLVFRLLETGQRERLTRILDRILKSGEPSPFLSRIMPEVVACRIACASCTQRLESALFAKPLPEPVWEDACGAFAAAGDVERMREYLRQVRTHWPVPPESDDINVIEALWKSRRGDHSGALALLSAAMARREISGLWEAMICEVLGRLVWESALSRERVTRAVSTVASVKVRLKRPLMMEYARSLQVGDLDKAAMTAGKLFRAYPRESIWSLVAVWNARRKGDGAGLSAALARGRAACRFNGTGLFALREMDAIEEAALGASH